MPNKMGNTLNRSGFMSPMNQSGKSKTWPPIMNAPEPTHKDPTGIMPKIDRKYNNGSGQATKNHRGEKA